MGTGFVGATGAIGLAVGPVVVARLVRQGKTILASLSASLPCEGLVPQGGIHCCPKGTCSILPEAAVIAQPCFRIMLRKPSSK